MAEPNALGLAALAVAEARARPLSRKAALFAVLAIDRAADALFDRQAGGDPLAFRARLKAEDAALGLVLDLADAAPEGPALLLQGMFVSPEAYPALHEADYMVGLYNGGRVERVMIVAPSAPSVEALPVLEQALVALQHQLA